MPFSVGVRLSVQIKLYDRFIQKAKFFEDRGLVWVTRIFKKIADRCLSKALRTLRRKEKRIDKAVYELLILCIEDLKD